MRNAQSRTISRAWEAIARGQEMQGRVGTNDEDTDLGVTDATNAGDAHDEDAHRPRESVDTAVSKTTTNGTSSSGSGASKRSGSKNPYKAYKDFRSRSRDLHRQHRGLMQWRPMRNVQFVKDEAKFAIRRVTKLGALDGRQPDVETEV